MVMSVFGALLWHHSAVVLHQFKPPLADPLRRAVNLVLFE